jgi:Domain of unknown function (DUF4268)
MDNQYKTVMSGGIYLIQGNGQLVKMEEQRYDSEDLLQRLLADYPDLLAGDQMVSAKPRRWLLVKREAELASEEDGSNRWSVDHLFLDQDGIPTIVEVKRSGDTRIRREVVGQMLEYAANAVVYWPVENIRAKFVARCEDAGKDADRELEDFLKGEMEAGKFWSQVETNFAAGKIRLLFVADEIPAELRRIVEFLNEQMKSAEVLAVEIKQFTGQGLKTLVPRVIGQTAEAERAKSTSGTTVAPFCFEYWTGVLKALEPSQILRPTATAWRLQHNAFDVGWLHFRLKAYFSLVQKTAGVWVHCYGPRGLENYQVLLVAKDQVEKAFGHNLVWESDESDNRGSLSFPIENFDANDSADWPRQHQLLAKELAALYHAVAPLVKKLDAEPDPTLKA